MQPSVDQLAPQFLVPGLRFAEGNGGLVKAIVHTDRCDGEIYLHGSHITHFQPHNQLPVLWMSQKSEFAEGKAIRGGVPICFPWFGANAADPTAPGHGYARIRTWNLLATEINDDGDVALTLGITIGNFELTYTATFGRSLGMSLSVTLSDQSSEAVSFEEALHTYLAIEDIHQVVIEGLESAAYIDKVDGMKQKPATDESIRFNGECDRVYLNTTETCTLRDLALARSIQISKTNSLCTVVWNPWINKSAAMPDFGDHEWQSMACIETANTAPLQPTLNPGDSHVMTAVVSLFP
ncbi:D-hexose-6-phosphate mutarotase [Novipirellula caenicola]|uniref:Putative glucose-6-phosphate 1-epimerase n=1 Tax=Novipirellula caenicola TaxID=1536901 RepID=A0ABP9VT92_9BACT